MPTLEVIMPRMSDTMEEGILLHWIKQQGDAIASGDPIAEIETEKATVEITAERDGVLAVVLAGEGDTVPVGSVIAIISWGDVAPEDVRAAALAEREKGSKPPIDESAPAVGGNAPSLSDDVRGKPEMEDTTTVSLAENRVRVSPLVRQLARHEGLDLSSIAGSGPGGRIIRRDVQLVSSQRSGPPQADELVQPTRQHVIMATRLAEAKRDIPHFYISREVDAGELLALHSSLKHVEPPLRASMTALLVRACALTIRHVPQVNASWQGTAIRNPASIGIGLAVTTDDDSLVVPVIRDADKRSFREVANATADCVERARAGKLHPSDMDGGTFTISNLGPMGVDRFQAIINPPQSAILAVGAVLRKPVVWNDQVVIRDRMDLTLSADHRVLSGATAARFLEALDALIRSPVGLLDI